MLARIIILLALCAGLAAAALADATALRLTRDYYNGQHELGQSYRMVPEQVRVVDCGGGRSVVHCRYGYAAREGDETGQDTRMFYLEGERVLGMSGYASGRLEGSAIWTPDEARVLVERALWDDMAHLDPFSALHTAWLEDPTEHDGITRRQLAGIILANWAVRQKTVLSADAVTRFMRQARTAVAGDPVRHPMVASELAWLHGAVDPADPAAERAQRELALELFAQRRTLVADPLVGQAYDRTAEHVADQLAVARGSAALARLRAERDPAIALALLRSGSWSSLAELERAVVDQWMQDAMARDNLGGLSPRQVAAAVLGAVAVVDPQQRLDEDEVVALRGTLGASIPKDPAVAGILVRLCRAGSERDAFLAYATLRSIAERAPAIAAADPDPLARRLASSLVTDSEQLLALYTDDGWERSYGTLRDQILAFIERGDADLDAFGEAEIGWTARLTELEDHARGSSARRRIRALDHVLNAMASTLVNNVGEAIEELERAHELAVDGSDTALIQWLAGMME